MNSITKKIIIYLLSIITIFLMLYIIGFTINNDIIFPAPSSIFIALIDLLKSLDSYVILGYTLLRLIYINHTNIYN